jgi:hypothetical protein
MIFAVFEIIVFLSVQADAEGNLYFWNGIVPCSGKCGNDLAGYLGAVTGAAADSQYSRGHFLRFRVVLSFACSSAVVVFH